MEDDLALQFGKLNTLEGGEPDGILGGSGIDDNLVDVRRDAQGSCNLIVNYLPHDIDDISLKGLFSEFGEILMTKVVRDKNTKKSLGYGFVKFLREEDAIFAIERLNGFSLGSKILKVSIARPPSLEIRNCKLYVTNLPKEYGEAEVIALFQEFGEIIECRVLKDRNARQNKGVAFVQFNVKAQANNALSLNGCQLDGSSRGLVVKYAEDQHKKKELDRLQSLTANPNFRSLGGLGPDGLDEGKMRMNGMGGKMDSLAEAYYYQQQGLASLYGNQGSPMVNPSMLNPPMANNQLPLYLPTTAGPGPNDFGAKKMLPRQRKPYPHDPTMEPNQWYNPMPQQIPYHTSPPLGHNSLHVQPPMDMGMPGHLHGMGPPMMSPSEQLPMPPQQNRYLREPTGPVPRVPADPSMGRREEPSLNAGGGGVSLNVDGLPSNADVALLQDIFAQYGRILSAQIDMEPTTNGRGGSCSGRGRVQMSSMAQAEYAVQALSGSVLFEGEPPIHVSMNMNGSSR